MPGPFFEAKAGINLHLTVFGTSAWSGSHNSCLPGRKLTFGWSNVIMVVIEVIIRVCDVTVHQFKQQRKNENVGTTE